MGQGACAFLVFAATCILAIASAATSAATYPTLQHPPQFGYDTLGHAVFAHVTKPEPFNSTDLDFLQKFSIVQFDKAQGQSLGGAVEDRFIAAAKQVKERNPNVTTLFYLNALIDFSIFWRISNVTVKQPHDYLLYNTKGDMVYTLKPYGTLDHSKQATRNLFVDDCLYGINSGFFDGCFIDRANYALQVLHMHNGSIPNLGWDRPTTIKTVQAESQLFQALMTAVGQKHIILAKETSNLTPMEDWQYANALMVTDTFCSEYDNNGNAKPYDPVQCRFDIENVRNASRRGQLTQSHGMGGMNNDTQRDFTMACFLVAMGNMSFFSYAGDTSGEAWSLEGTRWWPEYDLPLGEPLGEAVVSPDGWTYQRRFKSGTSVTVDVRNHNAHIQWARRGHPSTS